VVTPNYMMVTEVAGEEVSVEQIERTISRYGWARGYCQDKDVLEVACGTGQGLGCLVDVARSLSACDISKEMLQQAKASMGSQVDFKEAPAEILPWPSDSKDVILCYEAIYYFDDLDKFMREARRVLRKTGKLLLVVCNKDLFDFTPSPFAKEYFGARELGWLCEKYGYTTRFFGGTKFKNVNLWQRGLRPVKALISRLGLMPGSMKSKKVLKRIVFGKLKPMPKKLSMDSMLYSPPDPIDHSQPNHDYKVIFCEATAGSSDPTK
jgi:ubiquinone/menaquinone biosynthesis C-methylase UbiE